MEPSVKLQKMMNYSQWPILLVGGLLLALTILIVVLLIRRMISLQKAHRKATMKEILWVKPDMASLKRDYIARLEKIERDYYQNPSDIRGTYERMSTLIRKFAYRATGVEVQNYSLFEIKATHMKGLAMLIEEFYKPEFDKISQGDVKVSIAKTKRMITEWN
ncbi:MAG: hypothetical protein MJ094_06455 [Saccharofermentans sp.]|nr:hypothetical protein [Saccharofermentans sp.]